MVVIECPIDGCSYQTSDQPIELVIKLLGLHEIQHQQQQQRTQPVQTKAPKMPRPHIDIGVNQESFNTFKRRWEAYRLGSCINDSMAAIQLFQCASEKLGDLLLKSDPKLMMRSEEAVLKQMEIVAVIKVSIGVTRTELMRVVQDNDEAFRTFALRVRGKAETCNFQTSVKCEKCHETTTADYTEEVIKDVMLAGISDVDIRREIIGCQGIHAKPVNEIISVIESREMGRQATGENHSISAVSTFKQQKRVGSLHGTEGDKNKQIPCPGCKKMFHSYRKGKFGWNTKPFKQCLNCWRASSRQQNSVEASSSTGDGDMLQQSSLTNLQISSIEKRHPVVLDNIILRKKELRRVKTADHPRVTFQLKHIKKERPVLVEGVADSGAQSNLWGFKAFQEAGFQRSDLEPVAINIRAANKNPIKILGAFNAVFKGISPTNKSISCTGTVYVSDTVSDFFLSYDTMVDLKILSRNFPTIGEKLGNNESKCIATNRASDSQPADSPPVLSDPQPADSPPSVPSNDCTTTDTCQCPQRSSVPAKPSALPFEPTEENNGRMRDWLLKFFASSTFNTCPHRPLQEMDGPPLEFHVDPEAKPRACHTATPVPLHWQKQDREDLARDVALGVIEKVPYGEPSPWCHRTVMIRKPDGTFRRTVDLSPLNKYCRRETYSSESPFNLARRVPRDTWKSVTDAWNGYHSVPLRESDRPLTTFITMQGRYRYIRAPQGFVSSGDGYNRRFQAILADFERKERCVDDTIHYDVDLKTHWWRTIELLIKLGSSGIVLNPKKFQFARKTVEFAGFKISKDSIEPLPKYLNAIRDFPTPKKSTDIRSWFGLINQVSNYAKLRDLMAPFRDFLSPKMKFKWTDELDATFNRSKELIVEAIHQGVKIFDLNRQTCLRPDWSSKGIGYFLTQKHCECPGRLPDCCENGWVITLAGSRFLSGAEKRYAAIEGEALAIAWGLEQSKYFTQGCNDLLVVTDHKPLTKIFGDRTLDEISNTRLFRLKQRTLPWLFDIAYMPGETNLAADAASRHPSSSMCQLLTVTDQDEEELVNAAISRDLQEMTTITWEKMVTATTNDNVLSTLLSHLEEGISTWEPLFSQYTRYKDALYTLKGVVMYKDRVVVPESLRPSVLRNLHAAHQGVSSMEQRAQAIMFWPGMTRDIHKERSECYHCNRNAPSNAHIPSASPNPPSTPFEKIFCDFFSFGGNHYLVIGDRLSGWTEIFSTPTGSSHSGARGLISCLRTLFSTFGVPQELSSDGGPEFISDVTRRFLKDWDVAHRISSAYYPQSNGRAEVAVKSAKRLLRANVEHRSGSLNSDKFLRAMLQLRNTPDPDCSLSPAEIVFGRPLRDSFSFINRLEKFSNPAVRKTWRDAWAAKEDALRVRFTKSTERLNEHSRELPPLTVGDRCLVQNQTGNYPRRWDRSGVITEVLPFDQYTVKIDGSCRVTRRNRRFLKIYTPVDTTIRDVMPSVPYDAPYDATTEAPDRTFVHEPTEAVELPTREPVYTNAQRDDAPAHHSRAPVRVEKSKRIPAALKRLADYNNPGLQECVPEGRRGRAL